MIGVKKSTLTISHTCFFLSRKQSYTYGKQPSGSPRQLDGILIFFSPEIYQESKVNQNKKCLFIEHPRNGKTWETITNLSACINWIEFQLFPSTLTVSHRIPRENRVPPIRPFQVRWTSDPRRLKHPVLRRRRNKKFPCPSKGQQKRTPQMLMHNGKQKTLKKTRRNKQNHKNPKSGCNRLKNVKWEPNNQQKRSPKNKDGRSTCSDGDDPFFAEKEEGRSGQKR